MCFWVSIRLDFEQGVKFQLESDIASMKKVILCYFLYYAIINNNNNKIFIY